MAEDKKESKGQKRYNHGPKIKDAGMAGGSGEEAASKKAESSAGSGESHADKGGGAAPKPAESAGTDGIPVHDVHVREMAAMNSRHEKERRDMNTRHEGEHKSMHGKHSKELAGGTGEKAASEKAAKTAED